MDILAIIFSPIFIIALTVPIVLIFGFLIGAYFSAPRHDRVQKLQPENGRGVDYEVKSQDATNVYCDPLGDEPPKKFIKTGFALNMLRKGLLGRLQHYALWNGRYGTAYTYSYGSPAIVLSLKEAIFQYLGEADYSRMPQDLQAKVEADLKKYRLGGEKVETTLEDTMKNLFTQEKYVLLPEETRLKIKQAEVGVIVEFPGVPLTPAGLPSITDDDVHKDNDQKVINALVNGIKKLGSGGTSQLILILLPMIGVIIGLVLGYMFKIGGTTTVVQQTITNSTRS